MNGQWRASSLIGGILLLLVAHAPGYGQTVSAVCTFPGCTLLSPGWPPTNPWQEINLIFTFPKLVKPEDVGRATLAVTGTMEMFVRQHPGLPLSTCSEIVHANAFTGTFATASNGYRVALAGQPFSTDKLEVFETWPFGGFSGAHRTTQTNDVTALIRSLIPPGGTTSITVPWRFVSAPCNLVAFKFVAPTLAITARPPFCEPGMVSNVILPAISPLPPVDSKPWRISYGLLPLDFTVTDQTTSCHAESSEGALRVFAVNLETGANVHFANSIATATLRFFAPGMAVVPQPCDFSPLPFVGVNNDCLLNEFDPNAHFVEWHTDGFETVLLPEVAVPGLPPISPIPTAGPYTFWVNLDALNLSPQQHTVDQVIRSVEPWIHAELIDHLFAIDAWTFIQDPGEINLFVIDRNGRATGRLPDGRVVVDVPGSVYIPSADNPLVVIHGSVSGTFQVVVNARAATGFDLVIYTTYPNGPVPVFTFDGTLASGQSAGFRLSLDPASADQSVHPTLVVDADLDGDGAVGCSDLSIVRRAYGSRAGQSLFNAWADRVVSGGIDLRDLAYVSRKVPAGTVCR